MPSAHRNQIVDVRVAVVAPEHHVMDLALIERHLTPTTNTGAMHRPQFAALRPVHRALAATEVPDDPVGVEGARVTSASQHNRRAVSTGNGIPAAVSQIPWSW